MVNHLMYMDDIKLFAKNEKELESLIHAVRIYIQDIGMEFGIEKMCHARHEKWQTTFDWGMELPNQDQIRTLGENETCKYLGNLEVDTIKKEDVKEKIQKEYFRRTRKLLETKLSSGNLIKIINTWDVSLVKYSELFLSGPEKNLNKWTKEQEI